MGSTQPQAIQRKSEGWERGAAEHCLPCAEAEGSVWSMGGNREWEGKRQSEIPAEKMGMGISRQEEVAQVCCRSEQAGQGNLRNWQGLASWLEWKACFEGEGREQYGKGTCNLSAKLQADQGNILAS